MYGELSYQEILERYHVSGSTFSSWLHKYRVEVLRRESPKGIPLYVFQPEDQMSRNEHEELERLRREVEDLKLINRTWEILARLSKERYNIDFKKNFGEMQSMKAAPGSDLPEGGNG